MQRGGSGPGEVGLYAWWQVSSRMRGLSEAKTEEAEEAVNGKVVIERFGAAALGEVKMVYIGYNVRY
jgi:hypothetical protein